MQMVGHQAPCMNCQTFLFSKIIQGFNYNLFKNGASKNIDSVDNIKSQIIAGALLTNHGLIFIRHNQGLSFTKGFLWASNSRLYNSKCRSEQQKQKNIKQLYFSACFTDPRHSICDQV